MKKFLFVVIFAIVALGVWGQEEKVLIKAVGNDITLEEYDIPDSSGLLTWSIRMKLKYKDLVLDLVKGHTNCYVTDTQGKGAYSVIVAPSYTDWKTRERYYCVIIIYVTGPTLETIRQQNLTTKDVIMNHTKHEFIGSGMVVQQIPNSTAVPLDN